MVTKLSKMKMPEAKSAKGSKTAGKPVVGLELDLDGMSDDSAQEEDPLVGDEDMSGEGISAGEGEETPAEENAELSKLSDDELLAELKKRGLRSEPEAQGADEQDDQSMYS